MWKRWVIAAAVIAATGAHAQTKKELVDKVLQLQQPGIEGTARVIAAQTTAQVVREVNRAVTRLSPERREEVRKKIQDDLRAFFNEIEPELRKRAVAIAPATMGNVFEERFSDEELKQLIAWLESPVAKKYQQAVPELQNGLTQKLVAESRPFVEPRLKALQQTLRQRLAPPPAGAPASPASAGK